MRHCLVVRLGSLAVSVFTCESVTFTSRLRVGPGMYHVYYGFNNHKNIVFCQILFLAMLDLARISCVVGLFSFIPVLSIIFS